MTVHNWRLRAACRDHDPEMWFSTGKQGDEAKAICHRCPVQRECGDYADTTHVYGIWAGQRKPIHQLFDHYASPLTGVLLKPHGTAAALRRHYRLKEPACEACLQWERQRKRQRPEREAANQ